MSSSGETGMTVREIIDILENVIDKNQEVSVREGYSDEWKRIDSVSIGIAPGNEETYVVLDSSDYL